MKALNHFIGLFFITILFGMTSCTKQDLDINERSHFAPTTKAATAASVNIAPPILINDAAYNLPSDPFTAIDLTIEDEIIMLSTNYTGGCKVAQFRLVANSQIQYGSGNIPIFSGKLILDNNDKCSHKVKKMVSYDLTPLQQSGHNQVILQIADFGEVLYSY